MYSCPACGEENVARQMTCRCGADLMLLATLDSLTEQWFNQALAALAENKPGRALEWLSAYCVAKPADAAALRNLARLWARLECPAEAADALDRATVLDPTSPDIADIRDAIENPKQTTLPLSINTPNTSHGNENHQKDEEIQ